MFFTKNDFEKIAEYIKANSMRDTDFPKKESVLANSDILTIVSNGVNYKIYILDLLKSGIPLITIDKLKAVSIETSDIKVAESITVDANNIHLNNDKGTTLLDILNYFENNKLDRHNSDTFKGGNLTIEHKLDVKEELNIQSGRLNIKEVPVLVKTTSTGNNLVIDSDLTVLGDIKDGKNNILNDTTLAAKGWKIELGTSSSPSVRESYYLKDYKGNSYGLINIYKDSAILDIKLGYENANYETPEGQKPYINPGTHEAPNDDRLCILYSLSDGTLDLVKINLSAFLTEAEVDLNRGLGVDASTKKIYLKLADDNVTRAYISFNENTGALSAAGIEDRILLDLGTITDSLAGDSTMWGLYKLHEGTLENSLSNDNSRWGKFKEAEEVRSLLVSDEINRIQTKVDEVNLETIKKAQDAAIQVIADREIEILSKTDATLISSNTGGLEGNNIQANLNELVSAINNNDGQIASLRKDTNTKLTKLEQNVPECKSDLESTFSICDEQRNAILQIEQGHLRTKHFDSRATPSCGIGVESSFNICDEQLNVVLQIGNGDIKTKDFDSSLFKLKGKKISIYGDSISTFGYHYADRVAGDYMGCQNVQAYYCADYASNSLKSPDETWWGQVIKLTGATLNYVRSLGGGSVTNYLQNHATEICSNGSTGDAPDIVLLECGTNDIGWTQYQLGTPEDFENGITNTFYGAYINMLNIIQTNFPNTQVVCLTPLYSAVLGTNIPPYQQKNDNGKTPRDYADAIIHCAKMMNVKYIDLMSLVNINRFNHSSLLYDETHPNKRGMTMIATIVANNLINLISK